MARTKRIHKEARKPKRITGKIPKPLRYEPTKLKFYTGRPA